jgi:hypothetical protein
MQEVVHEEPQERATDTHQEAHVNIPSQAVTASTAEPSEDASDPAPSNMRDRWINMQPLHVATEATVAAVVQTATEGSAQIPQRRSEVSLEYVMPDEHAKIERSRVPEGLRPAHSNLQPDTPSHLAVLQARMQVLEDCLDNKGQANSENLREDMAIIKTELQDHIQVHLLLMYQLALVFCTVASLIFAGLYHHMNGLLDSMLYP